MAKSRMCRWCDACFSTYVVAGCGCGRSYRKIPRHRSAATSAEIAAWDIDVRPDFKGLPTGAGSVKKGQGVWEAQCESCHGVFGESNEVFPPIAGGVSKRDMEVGRVANLKREDYPQRTTLMKLSQISTLWDYINRAMPWNNPKTLTVEEVYAVTAYILHLGDIVPADFVLSDQNIREVQNRLPNRDGLRKFLPLWEVKGKGDVQNTACMTNCVAAVNITSRLPEHARNAHGNLAEQQRLIGAIRGADTTRPAPTRHPVGSSIPAYTSATSSSLPVTSVTQMGAAAIAKKYNCNACHAAVNKLVGPSYVEISKKYQTDSAALAKMMDKIRKGGSGNWGAIPMPPHPQINETELRALAEWSLSGGK